MTKIVSPGASGGRRSNKNIALILLSIALVFLGGIIAKYWFQRGG